MQRVAQELLSNKISENGSGEIPLVIDGTGAFFHYKSPGEPIGDLLHDTLGEMILKNSRINESTYERVKKERGCVQCQLDPYCRGNTVNDSFSQNEDFHHLDWCRARKDFVLGILMNQTMKRNEEY
jgi:radical SAM protein with 4Fe4S-binding SPASM domain